MTEALMISAFEGLSKFSVIYFFVLAITSSTLAV